MIAKKSALVAIPEELVSANAAPLLCAGVTTFRRFSPAGQNQAISWPFKARADWVIWPCCSLAEWVSESWRSPGVKPSVHKALVWARMRTSTAR